MIQMIKYEDNSNKVIYESVKNNMKMPVHISKIELDGSETNCQIPMHWHRSIEIIVPRKNTTETWIEGKTYYTSPNHFLIINSKQVHRCRDAVVHQGYLGYAIQINYEFIKSIYSHIDSYYFDTICHDESKILDILNKMIEAYFQNDSLKNIQIIGLAYELLYILLSQDCQLKNEGYAIQSEKQKDKLVDILTYIDNECDHITNIKSIAEHFHLSYGYVAKLFKTYLHITIHDSLTMARIKKVENDLITTDKPITEIYAAHGFTNAKSFYREFAKYHELTPKQYRKDARSRNNMRNS